LSKAKADFVAGVQGACRIGIWSWFDETVSAEIYR
jgi:hypothetical protein